jgi:WD40 repeat protein
MSAPETQTPAGRAESSVKLVSNKALTLPTAVLAIDGHPDGNRLFAACFDGGIYEVAIESGTHKLLGRHESYASGIQYLPKSDRLISAGYDGTLRWFDPAGGKPIRTVAAHKFWSWKMRVSSDEKFVGTVTGQYMAGGYKYEPAAEQEPSVKVFETETGKLRWAFSHVPPVLSVAFSLDSRYLAAANMMGEVRVWDLETGKRAAAWTTPDFTCWGIIKSHHYVGGIFDLIFSPDGRELIVCGMGPMVDPMAGNGKQTWQRFAWQENPPRKVAEIRETDAGHGLMEVVRLHPDHKAFVMAGRLAQGKWNTALFDAASGTLLHSIDTKMRVTDAAWLNGGAQMALAGATSQAKKKDGICPDFGHIKLFDLQRQVPPAPSRHA